MPTTPTLALPYPAPTATPDVPYDLQQLAEKVESVLDTTRPRALATIASAPSIANASTVALSYDTNVVNVGSVHSTSVNPTRFTATKAGLYLVQANIEYTAFSAGYARIQFRFNGTVYGAGTVIDANSATINLSISQYWQAAANDYMEVTHFQNTGAAKSPVVTDQSYRAGAMWLCP